MIVKLGTWRLMILLAALLLIQGAAAAWAQKKDKGGGGGGGETPPAATVIPLTNASYVSAMTDVADQVAVVVGGAIDDGGEYPACWLVHAAGGILEQQLMPLDATGQSRPHAINARLQIVGEHVRAEDSKRVPIFWPSPSAAPIELSMPNNRAGVASGITDDGLIVGLAPVKTSDLTAEMQQDLVAWQIGEDDEGLLTVSAGQLISVGAYNASLPTISSLSGHVCGTLYVGYPASGWGTRAFRLRLVWNETAPEIAEDSLEIPFDHLAYSESASVNNLGTLAGSHTGLSGKFRDGFVYTLGGTYLDIPELPSFRHKGILYEYHTDHVSAVNDTHEMLTRSVAARPSDGQIWGPTELAVARPGGTAISVRSLHPGWATSSENVVGWHLNSDGWIIASLTGEDIPTVIIRP